jgi:hypothetical protein
MIPGTGNGAESNSGDSFLTEKTATPTTYGEKFAQLTQRETLPAPGELQETWRGQLLEASPTVGSRFRRGLDAGTLEAGDVLAAAAGLAAELAKVIPVLRHGGANQAAADLVRRLPVPPGKSDWPGVPGSRRTRRTLVAIDELIRITHALGHGHKEPSGLAEWNQWKTEWDRLKMLSNYKAFLEGRLHQGPGPKNKLRLTTATPRHLAVWVLGHLAGLSNHAIGCFLVHVGLSGVRSPASRPVARIHDRSLLDEVKDARKALDEGRIGGVSPRSLIHGVEAAAVMDQFAGLGGLPR